MKKRELIFATHNHNKLSEIQVIAGNLCEIKNLQEVGFHEEVEETGLTLEENALLKARTVHKKTGKDCFADDSGLEVNILDRAPGVHSARYAGIPTDSEKNMMKLLTHLEGKPDRSARFRTVIALIIEGKEHLFEGEIWGHILHEKRGNEGFGYDPIFQPEGLEQSFAELSPEEKARISHRSKALVKMLDFLKEQG